MSDTIKLLLKHIYTLMAIATNGGVNTLEFIGYCNSNGLNWEDEWTKAIDGKDEDDEEPTLFTALVIKHMFEQMKEALTIEERDYFRSLFSDEPQPTT